jgi:hypothetical protein
MGYRMLDEPGGREIPFTTAPRDRDEALLMMFQRAAEKGEGTSRLLEKDGAPVVKLRVGKPSPTGFPSFQIDWFD